MKMVSHDRVVELAVTASAVILYALGAAFLFAPQELAELMNLPAESSLIVSLLGAAYLGFGAVSWVARKSLLGGIYGRAVIMGNQLHFVVGAITVLRNLDRGNGSPVFFFLVAFYCLGAALFLSLLFYRPGRPV